MTLYTFSKSRTGVLLLIIAMVAVGCGNPRYETFYGKTTPLPGQVMRYVTGSEPETLDPHIGTGQAEARIYMALFEGLCEYDPKNMEPIPAIAERWEINSDFSEYVFHLRRNARWSNGQQITARDFLYSFRRSLSPKLAAPNANFGYYIKYAEAFNARKVFVLDPGNNTYLLAKDFLGEAAAEATGAETTLGPDTEFHRYIHSPNRLVLPGDEGARAKAVKNNPTLQAALAGKVFETVTAEHIGVEAVDDYTFRITLSQTALFFLKLMAQPLFRLVTKDISEQSRAAWSEPEKVVTSGAFKLKSWMPYHELIVVRDPNYWDAARVQLDEIRFYPMDQTWTMMNLYQVGQVDATYNHTVPIGWLDMIRPLKDYMDAPEAAIVYYQFNVTQPPTNDVRVRKAFNMAVDKAAFSSWRRVTKPLTALSPEEIFPGYPRPKGDSFDPVKARELLAQAGYKDAAGNYDPQKFPVEEVAISFNSVGGNRNDAEVLQAYWKQNLGLTLPLKGFESRTFWPMRRKLEYKGIARGSFAADYMDPYTFLNVFTSSNGTGWYDAEFVAMLDEANRMRDPQQRYELLARAEARLLDAQPIIPLVTDATNWLKKPYVKGMYPNPATMHPWKFVCIEHDPAKWDYGVPRLSYEKKDADFKEREKELPVCSK